MSKIEDKINQAKPTDWVVEGIPKYKQWLIVKLTRFQLKLYKLIKGR